MTATLNRKQRILAAVILGVLSCLAALVCGPAKAQTQRDVALQTANSAKALAAPDFAIADFDGDAKPDLATVQPGAALASRTNYWIHFAFSTGSDRSISLLAPTGGLQIASRDVNGDSFLDVVVSTRLANEPVAVLLNDGRGNFRLADVRGFSATIWEVPTGLRGCADCLSDPHAAMGNVSWAFGALLPAARFAYLPPVNERLVCHGAIEKLSAVARGLHGRAPPQV